MSAFCKTPLWDQELLDHPSEPDLSECFHATVLAWVPCAFLWSCLPYYINIAKSTSWGMMRNFYHLGMTSLFISKQFLLLLLSLSELVLLIGEVAAGELAAVHYVTPVVLLVTFVFDAAAVALHQAKGHVSSKIQFSFWTLFVALATPTLASSIRMRQENEGEWNVALRASIRIATFVLGLFSWLLHCVTDDKATCSKSTGNMKRESPEEKASPLAELFFTWLDPLVWQGFRQPPLRMEDAYELKGELEAKCINKKFGKHFQHLFHSPKTCEGFGNPHFDKSQDDGIGVEMMDIARMASLTEPSSSPRQGVESDKEALKGVNVLPALLKAFGGKIGESIVIKVFHDMLKFVAPQVLKLLILFVQEKDTDSWRGYCLAVLLLVCNMLQLILLQQYWVRVYQAGMEMKTAAVGAIYRKSLCLSNSARRAHSKGQIVSLVTTDAQALEEALPSLNMVWSMPLQILVALYFLYSELGSAVFSGVAILVMLIPFNIVTGRYNTRFQRAQMKCKDRRIRAMYEILNSIKIIKFNAWEERFMDKVSQIRSEEVGFLKKNATLKAFINFVFGSAPILVTLASFATFVTIDETNVLTADKVFVCISLFNLLRLPMHLLPMGITETLRFAVSIRRINKFMSADELSRNRIERRESGNEEDSNVIEIKNASFSWGDREAPVLSDINLVVPTGSLVAVVGRVGAGKSSLLSTILGETETLTGEVHLRDCHRIAYVTQQPWIQNATIKDNILFGGKDDQQGWYEEVVSACALWDDFNQLSSGDSTVIGENGINLSGGQKQRVSIGRAAFKKAQLYVLDDPLSALDSHTSNHVFEEVFSNQGILRGSTRILATHRTNVVAKADFTLVMKGGKIADFGPTSKLLHAGSELSLLLMEEEQSDAENEVKSQVKGVANGGPKREKETIVTTSGNDKASTKADKAKEAEKRIKDEDVLSGRVKLMAYHKYISSLGYLNFVVIILTFLGNQAISTGSTFWLAVWSDHSTEVLEAAFENGTTTESFNNGYYVGVLGGFGAGQALASFIRNWFFYFTCANCSVLIHDQLLKVIIKARVRFFDITPTGSIINRFSGDMHVVDLTLPMKLSALLYTLIEVTSVIIMISFLFPAFIAAVIPLSFVYYALLKIYIPSSRQLQRFYSSTKSPINLHFSETVQGASTIRAFGAQDRFIMESENLVQSNSKFKYLTIICKRWLGLRSECMGNLVVLIAACLAISQRDTVSAGWIGLTISYALSITETFNWLLINSSLVEEHTVSIERIRETEKYTPTEGPWRIPESDPKDPKWLKDGALELTELTMSYAPELEPVLKGIDLSIEAGQKIGVCGRTGAGKSSLSVALFNLVESWSGSIRLDGVEVKNIGLHTLRSQLTVIPQDPLLFNRSVRQNIDPTESHLDERVWKVLEQSQMKDVVKGLKGGLDHEVEEGGANFSVGQRQLMCLARALLRESAIVVLDEATASMDEDTDAKVQETLFRELSGRTLITIAHRLDTIVEYDRILVMDQGRVMEFDSPETLLADKNSTFYALMQKHLE